MRSILVSCAPGLLLAGCGAQTPPPAVEVKVVKEVVEVQRPCAVTVPQRPAPVGALPADAVKALAIVGAKLAEWAGPGKYGERADAALRSCTKN